MMRQLRLIEGTLLIAALTSAGPALAQSSPTIIQSEGTAAVEVAPNEMGFRLERNFSGPALTDAMRQFRAFERSIAQGVTDLELAISRQDPARLRVRQRAVQIEASLTLWIATPGTSGDAQAEALVETSERVRKLAASVSANVGFAGYGVTDREPLEQEAVARAAENALYLAEAAGALAQRHVVDVERLTVLETSWDGVAPSDGSMPIPPNVSCRARVRIEYRFESGAAPQN
jgi:hypothetical protein